MSLFYEKFIRACSVKNVSATSAIKKCGLSAGTVTIWRQGASPREKNLITLSDYFSIKPEYFIDDSISVDSIEMYYKEEILNLDFEFMADLCHRLSAFNAEQLLQVENFIDELIQN